MTRRGLKMTLNLAHAISKALVYISLVSDVDFVIFVIEQMSLN